MSNFDVKHLEPLLDWDQRKYPIYANQIEFGMFRTHAWDTVKTYCDQKGIRVMAYGVIGGLKREMLIDHDLVKAAAENRTAENAMFQWALNEGVTVLMGSKKKKHMDQFLALAPTQEKVIKTDIPIDERTKCYEPDVSTKKSSGSL